MKPKQIISITLKIIGVIAFWKAVQASPALLNIAGVISSYLGMSSQVGAGGLFLFTIVLSMAASIAVPLAVAYFFILKTDIIIPYFGLEDESIGELNVREQTIYRLVVIVFAFVVILSGANNFISYTYNTNINTEYVTNNTNNFNQSQGFNNEQRVTTTKTNSKHVNYFALAEIILGVILLVKEKKYAQKLEQSCCEPELNNE